MRSLCIAALLLALTSASASAATPVPSAFFKLSRVQASSHGKSVSFSVALEKVAATDRPVLAWSLAPSGGAACEDSGYPNGVRSRNGLVFWDQQGPTFTWVIGSAARCTGRVSVVAENQDEHCTATAEVTSKGTTSTSPACALGGYAVGFSTLPVPASVFRTYSRVQAQLREPARSAAGAERQIRDVLREQAAAFAVFPPVWFCNFARTFAPIAALRADLTRGANAAAVRDARAAANALKCAPSAVQHAFDTLATSAKPQPTVLTATLEHYFPTIFGLRYNDLVNGFAAENVALAEAAAAAGKSSAATGELAAVAHSAQTIGKSLNHYQASVVKVENAQG